MSELETDIGSDSGSEINADRGALLLAICNGIVRLYKQYYGKGPTKARAYYDGDVVTCVLRDVYTRAERTLLESGRETVVLTQRHELQQAVREEFIKIVEGLTERKVIGFFSGNQPEPDMSVEVFVLAHRNGQAG